MKNMLAYNLAAIRERQPDLADALEAGGGSDYPLVPARNGALTVQINGRWVHSRYNPQEEALRLLQASDVPDGAVIVCLGMGLGYHLDALQRQNKPFTALFIIEPDLALFRQALTLHDFRELFARGQVICGVRQTPPQIFELISSLAMVALAAPQVILEHPGATQSRRDYFAAVAPRLVDALRTGAANIATAQAQGAVMIRNALRNLSFAWRSPGIKNLRGYWTGMPAIIVSAGPSLEKNLEVLAQAPGRAALLCTDTAYRIISARSIRPDLIATIDFRAESARHFTGAAAQGVPLVFDIEAATESLSAYNGPLICSLNTAPLPFWLNAVLQDKGILERGMSVAHYLFALAVYCGCDPIIFVGQDLAYTGGMTHASGTHSRQTTAAHAAQGRKLIKVTATDGQELETGVDMYIYRQHFETLVAACGRECINATEGGAGIVGTSEMPLHRVLTEKCRRRIPALAIPPECGVAAESVAEGLQRLYDAVGQVRAASQSMGALLEEISQLAQRNSPDTARIVALFERMHQPAQVLRGQELILRMLYGETLAPMMELERSEHGLAAQAAETLPHRLSADTALQQAICRSAGFLEQELHDTIAQWPSSVPHGPETVAVSR